jgi:hypothetical protein
MFVGEKMSLNIRISFTPHHRIEEVMMNIDENPKKVEE